MKHFYSHIITTDSLIVKLSNMKMSDDERTHLLSLMESSLHHAILDAILSELTASDKKLFLKELADEDHDAIWTFLKKRIDNIEGKIEKTAEDLQEQLHQDIDEVNK